VGKKFPAAFSFAHDVSGSAAITRTLLILRLAVLRLKFRGDPKLERTP